MRQVIATLGDEQKMQYNQIEPFIMECMAFSSQIRWCNQDRFVLENEETVAPGGYLNRYGYFVIGTTIGGNAIVVSLNDPKIYFADHTWYGEDEIDYEDLKGNKEWCQLPYSLQNIRKSLFELTENKNSFITLLKNGQLEVIVDKID